LEILNGYAYSLIGGYCRVPTRGRRGARHLPVGVNLQSIIALVFTRELGNNPDIPESSLIKEVQRSKPLNDAQMGAVVKMISK
jgi:hypothetical protein